MLIAIAVAAVDQGTKALALARLSQDHRVTLVGDLLGLRLAFNAGTVLSFGSGSTWLLTVLAALVSLVIMPVVVSRARDVRRTVGLGLIWGGAVGNLVDRLAANPGFGRGRVTDFLAYGDLFIGNLADVALAAGVAVLGVLSWQAGRAEARSAGTPTLERSPSSTREPVERP